MFANALYLRARNDGVTIVVIFAQGVLGKCASENAKHSLNLVTYRILLPVIHIILQCRSTIEATAHTIVPWNRISLSSGYSNAPFILLDRTSRGEYEPDSAEYEPDSVI